MKNNLIIINFKTYLQGKDVLKLAKIIEKTDKNIIIGIPSSYIFEISKKTKLRVYAEHVDYFKPGRNTGFVLPEAVKESGAEGVFLNHSEHLINFNILKKTLNRCKKINLKTAVFASNLKEAKKIEKLNPDFLIIEPPEIVSGKISISKYKPELIKKISKNINIKFLVGAGIRNKEDIEIALKLGASGVAISSAIVKSKNPKKALNKLLK
jgi:triosephosphate isomerase (TIM)